MPNIIEISDLSMPGLEPYACRSEVHLLRWYEPQPGIFVAESPKVICRALDAGYQPLSLLVDRKQVTHPADDILERCGDIPVYMADSDIITEITGFRLILGVLCAMRRRTPPDAETVCAGAKRIAVLEAVENQTNVGAIFRSAAALNFDAVLLTHGCSDPLYRRSIRVSMGTVFQIPWTFLREPAPDYLAGLKKMGFAAAAMALCDDSADIADPRLRAQEKLAVILGNETEGLNPETIAACDFTVKIPMAHGVDSLNVAAASAVAFWELGKSGTGG